jgi:hypothetical protein
VRAATFLGYLKEFYINYVRVLYTLYPFCLGRSCTESSVQVVHQVISMLNPVVNITHAVLERSYQCSIRKKLYNKSTPRSTRKKSYINFSSCYTIKKLDSKSYPHRTRQKLSSTICPIMLYYCTQVLSKMY